jgi:hypothetical protein
VVPYPGRVLEELAALLGPERERQVDHALADHGVAVRRQVRLEQQVEDVAQAGAGAVQVVLVLARAVGAAGDDDLLEGGVEPAGRVVEGDRDLGHAGRRSPGAAGEDQILGLLAAQDAGALLAEHPAQRLRKI